MATISLARDSMDKKPVVSFLEVDGKLLSGEEFDEYCKSHGLCRRCARVRTHRRVVKLFGKGKKWEPLTVHAPSESPGRDVGNGTNNFDDDDDEDDFEDGDEFGAGRGRGRRASTQNQQEYLVYKGYCLQPTCYTMGQAKRLLGEGASAGGGGNRRSRRKRLTDRFKKRRPSKRNGMDDNGSVASGASNTSSRSTSSILSGISQRFRRGSRHKRRSSSASFSSASSMSSMDFSDDDTIDSSMMMMDASSVHSGANTGASSAHLEPGETSPIVQHRVEQLVMYDYFTVLDLSKVVLRQEEITAITNAFQKTTTLESIVLDKCSLKDEGLEQLAMSINQNLAKTLRKLSLRQNSIGNRGAMALEQHLLMNCPILEELDLSENSISSRGAVAVFSALQASQKLLHLNLAQNEIWDLDDGSFLRNTTSLEILNLDGNFMHDEGAEQIAVAISENNKCQLQKLYLGWNGISDDGATALAKMMEVNQSLEVLGLAENDISNTGARAILSALSINTSIREISGLYHNQIDRKFIIVAIKRLLHRYGDRSGLPGVPDAAAAAEAAPAGGAEDANNKDQQIAQTLAKDDKLNHAAAATAKAIAAANRNDDDDARSETSENSLNWAAQLYSTNNQEEADEEVEASSSRNNIALEAIEHWDWGTFGIEEIESPPPPPPPRRSQITKTTSKTIPEAAPDTSLQMPDMDDDDDDDGDNNAARLNSNANGHLGIAAVSSHASQASGAITPTDRLTVLQSAPLAYFNRATNEHHAVPLMDFEYERSVLKESLEDKEDELGSNIEVKFQTSATVQSMQKFFSTAPSPILHFSCFGNPDCLALENGFGYMQALPVSELRRYVQQAVRGKVKVVVVSSHYSRSIAEAFVKAGIQHVVCCQTEEVFRDVAAVEFTKLMYQELARNSTLQAAFHSALEGVSKSPLIKNVRNLPDKFKLLPEHAPATGYHDVPVFFQQSTFGDADGNDDDDDDDDEDAMFEDADTSILPPVPTQFLGREVDMYEILESLRVDDVVRVGGTKGCGKASVISAVSRYILARPKSFRINNVFWLPSPPGITPDEDSLYGDLCHVTEMLMKAEDDIWDEEEYSDARERILIELEGQKNIVVVDGRKFTTEASGENLERFLGCLLNEASVKIILATATEKTTGRTRTSRSEETIVSIGALDFKSSALLFGANCRFVSVDGSPTAHTPEEFASVLVPPSLSRSIEPSKNKTQRQRQLYQRLGNGNPRNIIDVANVMPISDFAEILRIAQRPEIQVDSAGTLEASLAKYTSMKDKAIRTHNYRRAQDLVDILEELEGLKSKYSSLVDLQAKERSLKRDLTAALAKRQYDEANSIKRKLLSLKKTIMKEKSAQQQSNNSNQAANEKLAELKAQMDNMLAMAEKMKMEKSLTELDASQKLEDDSETAEFAIQREDHTCVLHIHHQDALEFKYETGLSGIVTWANEACDLTSFNAGESFVRAGGLPFTQDLGSLPTLTDTKWGPVKIGTGEAVMLGPNTYGDLMSRFVILAVSPLSPTNDDDDWDTKKKKQNQSEHTNAQDEDALHFMEMSLRSSYRSSFSMIKASTMEAVAIPMITTKEDGETYDRSLKVGLQTIVDEAKFTDLKHVYVLANSTKEAITLIKMALTMGLSCLSG